MSMSLVSLSLAIRSTVSFKLQKDRGLIVWWRSSRSLEVSAPQQPHVQRERALRKYVGDYTLFMSGCFVLHRKESTLDYYSEGQRRIRKCRADLPSSDGSIVQELSTNFEHYSAPRYMRKPVLLRQRREPFGQFFRQVEDG